MYIFKFLKSLKLLRKEYLPDFDYFPKVKVIYYGQYKIEDLLEEHVSLDLLPNHESNIHYLAYAFLNDIYTIKYLPIDQFVNYINMLNEEDCKFKRSSLMLRDAAVFEAIWLFDKLACLKTNPFFEADIKYGFSAINLYRDNGHDHESLLNLFDNNPIRRDIFFEQFVYFVKKYVKHRLTKGTQVSSSSRFKEHLLNTIISYENESPNHYKSSLITNKENKEFDDFIQQLDTLDKLQKIDKKNLLYNTTNSN